MLEIKIFYICSILGILQENKESNSHRLIKKPYVLPQNWEKNENSLILERFLLISLCNNF